MLLILEVVTVVTVAVDTALQLSVLRVPMAWYSAFRPHPTPDGHLSPLSHLLRLPLSDFHSLSLTNDFVWLALFLIRLEYLWNKTVNATGKRHLHVAFDYLLGI